MSEGMERESPCVCPVPSFLGSGAVVSSLHGMWERRSKHSPHYAV